MPEFTDWVTDIVLPSIRRTNKYEINADENPYRELNEFLKNENATLKTENFKLKRREDESQLVNGKLTLADTQLMTSILSMKPTCVPVLVSISKREFLVIIRKEPETSDGDGHEYPYYGYRVQESGLSSSLSDLKQRFGNMLEILKVATPNAVNAFNLLFEKLEFLRRKDVIGNGNSRSLFSTNSFKIQDEFGID